MSLKNALKKATLITAVSLGPMAKADTLSSESVDFLNQGKTPDETYHEGLNNMAKKQKEISNNLF